MSDNSISSLQTRLPANPIRKYAAQIKEIRIERQIISRQCAGVFKKWPNYIYIYTNWSSIYITHANLTAAISILEIIHSHLTNGYLPVDPNNSRIILNLIKRKYLKILCVSNKVLYLFMTNFQCFYLRKFLTVSKTL